MPSVPGSQQKRSGLAAETGDVGGSLPIHPDPLYQQIPPSPLTQTSTFQHPSQSSTNSSPAPPQQPADNSMGLLGILKSILPPDASVHLSREAPGRGNPVDYNADFPSLDNGQHTHVYRSQPNSLEPEPAAHESPTSFPPPPPPPFTGQWPSAGKAFSAPPQGTSDGVESLVNLLVRAQKEKMAQQKQQAPQPAVGWQQQDLSYVDRVRLDQSSATSSQKEQLLDVLLRVQQQQQYQLQRHLPTLESNLAAMGGTRDPLFGAYGESPANAQLIQQLQNRLRQSRGDSQQQALTLQTLLQLQQQKKPQQLLIGSPRGQNLDGCHSEWPMGQIMPQRIEPSIPPINVQRPVSRVDPTSDRCWEYLDPKGVVRVSLALLSNSDVTVFLTRALSISMICANGVRWGILSRHSPFDVSRPKSLHPSAVCSLPAQHLESHSQATNKRDEWCFKLWDSLLHAWCIQCIVP